MKEKNKDLKSMLFGFSIIALYLLGSEMFLFIIENIGINYSNLSVNSKIIISSIYEFSITLIILYIYRKDFIPDLKNYIKKFREYFNKYFKYWIIAIVLMLISSMLIKPFTYTDTSANQEAVNSLIKNVPIYAIFTTVIIAPLLEESVFRLSFRKIFMHTNFLYIFFSGFIFGALHVLGSMKRISDLLFILPYSMPGFVFAYTYTKSKNICVPMGLHLFHNFVSVMLQMFL